MSENISDRRNLDSFLKYFMDMINYNTEYKNTNTSVLSNCLFTPDIIYLDPNQKICFLGDLHSDFDFMFLSLMTAKLINSSGEWIGKNTVLVQLGDMMDGKREDYELGVPISGDNETYIINFLKNLHLQAIKHGGMVITCIGNHDFNRLIMFKYDSDGKAVIPNKSNSYIYKNDSNPLYIGWNNLSEADLNVNPKYFLDRMANKYMTNSNNESFEHNQSLQNLLNPNKYPKNHKDGFHRQLLASCSTKMVVKFCWKNDLKIGGLASHGEKNHLDELASDLRDSLLIMLHKYGLNREIYRKILENNDNLIILINCVFAFGLRMLQNVHSDSVFLDWVYDNINNFSIANKKSFLFSRPPNNLLSYDNESVRDELNLFCRDIKRVLSYFNLNKDKSFSVSAHSGPSLNYIKEEEQGEMFQQEEEDYQEVASQPKNIRLNLCNQTQGTTLTDELVPINENNSYIMIDILGSRAFGSNTFKNIGRQPQLLVAMYDESNATQKIGVLKLMWLLGESDDNYHYRKDVDIIFDQIDNNKSIYDLPNIKKLVKSPENLSLVEIQMNDILYRRLQQSQEKQRRQLSQQQQLHRRDLEQKNTHFPWQSEFTLKHQQQKQQQQQQQHIESLSSVPNSSDVIEFIFNLYKKIQDIVGKNIFSVVNNNKEYYVDELETKIKLTLRKYDYSIAENVKNLINLVLAFDYNDYHFKNTYNIEDNIIKILKPIILIIISAIDTSSIQSKNPDYYPQNVYPILQKNMIGGLDNWTIAFNKFIQTIDLY